jgi:carbonic anhydrase
VLDIPPGEIMEYRNIGNLLSNNDLSAMSSVQYAVKISQVCIVHGISLSEYACLSNENLSLV